MTPSPCTPPIADPSPLAYRLAHSAGCLLMALVLCGAAAAAEPPAIPEPSRAELLYETHCVACHTSVAHRQLDRARSPAEVAASVRRWSDHQSLNWTESDIQDVTGFLIHRYYRLAPLSPAGGGAR